MLAVIACGTAGLVWAMNQPIETVAVQGRFQRVTPADVERVVKSCVHGAGLLSVDLAQVRRAIHTLPWVDAVSVERAWPRGLTVLVVEQTAAARWGERGLLNARGELFDSDERHIPPELAQLEGPPGKESLVAQRHLAAEGRLMQAGLRLTAMRPDARGAWEFDLANGVTVRLGRRQVDERFGEVHGRRLEARHAEGRGHLLRGYALHQRIRHRLARHCRPRRGPRGRS